MKPVMMSGLCSRWYSLSWSMRKRADSSFLSMYNAAWSAVKNASCIFKEAHVRPDRGEPGGDFQIRRSCTHSWDLNRMERKSGNGCDSVTEQEMRRLEAQSVSRRSHRAFYCIVFHPDNIFARMLSCTSDSIDDESNNNDPRPVWWF